MITTGILNALDNGDALASVLAHELAHLVERHVFQTYTASVVADCLIAASFPLIMRLFLWRKLVTFFGVIGGLSAIVLAALKNARNKEHEADYVGMLLMTQAGFHPAAFSPTLQEISKLQDRRLVAVMKDLPPIILSTHPDVC